jgi:hypothetical protein
VDCEGAHNSSQKAKSYSGEKKVGDKKNVFSHEMKKIFRGKKCSPETILYQKHILDQRSNNT